MVQENEVAQGCPADEFPLLEIVKLLPLLEVPLHEVPLVPEVPLLEVPLWELLAELPEVLPEVAELSVVAGLWRWDSGRGCCR